MPDNTDNSLIVPAVTITGGTGVAEGGGAVFTIAATSGTASSVAVNVEVAQQGVFTTNTGSRTVTVSAGGTATITIPTADDSADEPDGSITATVQSGTDYTVGTPSTASVTVSDDDPPTPVPDPASGLKLNSGDKRLTVLWSPSATSEGLLGYRVQWKLSSQTWDQAVLANQFHSTTDTRHTISGLANGSAYDVRVAAFNANGVSDWITGQATPAKPKPKPEPSLAFDSVSCASSGSGWVISVTWSKTPESLKPDIWANEAKNRGHRGRQTAVAGTSTTFDVPNAGWYQVGMQAKIAGNKKVGDSEPVRCR
ncbi:fibronectin type III domain-containing protein [Candidatus Poriferisocius sp.]|uniref:fibronectin type III domain-containing protein n=1 Tax=Candidatus Poriferisocius sp. TaxID=3101276 RepID=UPI003B598052